MSSIEIAESVEIPTGADRLWGLIATPSEVVTCIPGARIIEITDDGTINGAIEVKFGPAVVEFRGVVSVEYNNSDRTAVVNARGADRQGRTRASALMHINVKAQSATSSTFDAGGDVEMVGGLSAFLTTGGRLLAKQLMREFGANVAARCAPDESTTANACVAPADGVQGETAGREAAEGRVATPAPMQGFRMMWIVLQGWLRQVFGGK